MPTIYSGTRLRPGELTAGRLRPRPAAGARPRGRPARAGRPAPARSPRRRSARRTARRSAARPRSSAAGRRSRLSGHVEGRREGRVGGGAEEAGQRLARGRIEGAQRRRRLGERGREQDIDPLEVVGDLAADGLQLLHRDQILPPVDRATELDERPAQRFQVRLRGRSAQPLLPVGRSPGIAAGPLVDEVGDEGVAVDRQRRLFHPVAQRLAGPHRRGLHRRHAVHRAPRCRRARRTGPPHVAAVVGLPPRPRETDRATGAPRLGSPGTGPAIASRIAAESRTERVTTCSATRPPIRSP